MSKPVEDLLPTKPQSRLRIYAWSTKDIAKYDGCLKVGQTTLDVNTRIRRSQGVAQFEYTLEVDEVAEKSDGTFFRDSAVRERLKQKGFENVELEWMRCSAKDVVAAIQELKSGQQKVGNHTETFKLREEQSRAVKNTVKYFESIWSENKKAVPRFLWNAKMRFGKTFASYHLAKELGAHKILVVTFKPAVEDAWQVDLESHVDFADWQYFSKSTGGDPSKASKTKPLVYFGSFQDLLGKSKSGKIKAKNEWVHLTNWDLVIFDEYHFGAWKDSAKELFEGEDDLEAKREIENEFGKLLEEFKENLDNLNGTEKDFLPISSKAYLYLSGTPFKALATGEFIEEQIFNWTYADEQREKNRYSERNPEKWNPYAALPEMRLLTYQMPEELVAIANQGEFDEFDLNTFFQATGRGKNAVFKNKDDVQKWLNIIRGSHLAVQVDAMKTSESPPFPYSDSRLLPYMQHSFWFLPNVASCHAMSNLLAEKHNIFWHDYKVLTVAGVGAGVGLAALPPVRKAIGSGNESKTITLSCGKLTTGVTVPQWSSILMLRNLNSPETYFQAAFRVQSPWSIKNPNGDNPHEELVIKPVCFVFDFAPTRALRQIAEYGIGLSPEIKNPEVAVEELVKYLPVLAYDGSNMVQIDAIGILDTALAGTSATLLAKKWESPLLVNVDNETLKRIMRSEAAMSAVMKIEGFRKLGNSIFETVVNKSEAVKKTKREKGDKLSENQKRELTEEEKEYKSKRKQIQDKLIKFATTIPAFMYLTDFRENTLDDVITKIEPELFQAVTGLAVKEFELLKSVGVFNSNQMNQAVFAFRRYEDSSLSYTGIDSHPRRKHIGLYDTVVAMDQTLV
jgi:hypothetical protein